MRGLLRGIPEDCLLAASTMAFFARVTKRGSVISFISRFDRVIIFRNFRRESLVLKSIRLFVVNQLIQRLNFSWVYPIKTGLNWPR